jgi:hypothetical protein
MTLRRHGSIQLVRTVLALCVIAGAWTGTMAAAGCGDDAAEGTTSGRRVRLGTRVQPTVSLATSFTTAKGWEVTISHAYVSLGALYYYDGEPLQIAHAAPVVPSRRVGWLGAASAWAHPGHYQPGTAMGESLVPASIDLAAGATELAAGEGVSGPYRSATVSFQSPAVGAYAEQLGADVIVVEGSARQGADSKTFRIRASAADLTNAAGKLEVDACRFVAADVQADGEIVLSIDPRVWLDQVDFAAVGQGTAAAPAEVEPGSVAHQAFTLMGVTRATAYVLAYEPK